MLSVYFETYGCQMNVADSGLLSELLAHEGYQTVDNPESASLLVVNTCSVREHAEKRALGRIAELANACRKRGAGQKLWVVGCMAERLGESLKERLPGIDRVVGATRIESLHEHISGYLAHAERSGAVPAGPSPVSAFVPVMRGCDNYCAYCIVPYVRGREHSVPAQTVVESVQERVAGGAREVTLLGQNVNSYRDFSCPCDFAGLLRKVHEVQGLERIRFTTSHPKDCSEALIRTVAELPKACTHIHLPVQSGSTAVLARMNRGYTRDAYLRIVERIRALIPGADITTDVMTGFPGETDGDFRDTLSLFETVRYTQAFMFAFSPRTGTAAATMESQVPPVVARERLEELIRLQTAITRRHYDSMVGHTVELLLTERQAKRDHSWMGQDKGGKRALVACDEELAGAILRVVVTASSGMTLLCERENACGL